MNDAGRNEHQDTGKYQGGDPEGQGDSTDENHFRRLDRLSRTQGLNSRLAQFEFRFLEM